MRQHRYDDTRKTALKAARDGGTRARSLACNYAVIGVQTRILPFGHSIHLEVFVPSHFHRIFSFLSAKTHATGEKAQIEDAEVKKEGRKGEGETTRENERSDKLP